MRYLFIGALEQLNLSIVLQRLETHTKTGLLVVKQEAKWVEFYFRDGQLVCIGPPHSNATLAERLVQANIISPQAAQDVISEPATEMRVALTLIDLGYVRREELRTWATEKVVEVLRIVFAWPQGEIHFADEAVPPAGRLLVGMSITSLLDSLHTAADASSKLVSNQLTFSSKEEEDSSHLDDKQTPLPIPASVLTATSTLPPTRRIDPSFMRPEMVLMPSKLSDHQDQPRNVTLTPQQWRVLTCVNGYTSLQGVCQELGMTPATVCQIAAGLMDEGLLYAIDPTSEHGNMSFPAVGEVVAASLNNSYATSGIAIRPQPLASSLTSSYMLAKISVEAREQLSKGGRVQATSAQLDAPALTPSNAVYA